MIRPRSRSVTTLVVLSLCLTGVSSVRATETAPAADLFHATTLQGSVPALSEIYTVRTHTVTVAASVFGEPAPQPDQSAAALSLELFDDLEVKAVRESAFMNPSGSLSWIGAIEDDPESTVILVSKQGVTVGSIRFDGRLITLHYLGNGVHILYEIDETSSIYREDRPTEITIDDLSPTTDRIGGELKQTEADDGSLLDLMVVYTPAAKAGAGGAVAIENLIDLGVTETNLSYANSFVTPRLRLVHTQEVAYTESGSSQTDRDRLRIDGDGHIDEVHPLRDAHAADLVKMVVEPSGCGISYIMTNVTTAFEEFAFCVTTRSCISPNYTFGHELGHIQSARHDWFVDPSNNSPFTYNHGYVDPGDQWRTIMAYSNDCGGCTRLLYWSNPNVNHPVTGNAMGVAVGQPNAADNHLTLNTTAVTVANFRDSMTGIFADGFESGATTNWSLTSP